MYVYQAHISIKGKISINFQFLFHIRMYTAMQHIHRVCVCVVLGGSVCVFGGGGRGRVGRKLTRTSEKTLDLKLLV